MRSKREMFCQAYCAIKNKEPNQKQNKHETSWRNSCVNKIEKRYREGHTHTYIYTHIFVRRYMCMKIPKRIQLFPLVTQQQKNNTAGKNCAPMEVCNRNCSRHVKCSLGVCMCVCVGGGQWQRQGGVAGSCSICTRINRRQIRGLRWRRQ